MTPIWNSASGSCSFTIRIGVPNALPLDSGVLLRCLTDWGHEGGPPCKQGQLGRADPPGSKGALRGDPSKADECGQKPQGVSQQEITWVSPIPPSNSSPPQAPRAEALDDASHCHEQLRPLAGRVPGRWEGGPQQGTYTLWVCDLLSSYTLHTLYILPLHSLFLSQSV